MLLLWGLYVVGRALLPYAVALHIKPEEDLPTIRFGPLVRVARQFKKDPPD